MQRLKVLLIGSGGREHALAWAMASSPILEKLYACPGNPGIARHAELVSLQVEDHAAVIGFCHQQHIDLVVVGPEAPLVAGLADDLDKAGIKVFGPTKLAAQLEGSKGFTKDLCAEFNIPTGAYGRFTDLGAAEAYLAKQAIPIVIKADGLAAGKGVTVAMTREEAQAALVDIFSGRFGAAECVIEDYLDGEEVSFFALCDGENALALAAAQDHKRVGDGDVGPNTGGMGAYSPAPVFTAEMQARTMDEIILPTLRGMKARGTPFKGVLFAGLMITAKGPELIEYNVRFGDPECQVLMMRLKNDLLGLLWACVTGGLSAQEAQWWPGAALTVVMAAKGYPGEVMKGTEIHDLSVAEASEDVEIFHAGTKLEGDRLLANGGRVLNITGIGPSVADAKKRAYMAVEKINWPEGFCRQDIGWRAIARETAKA